MTLPRRTLLTTSLGAALALILTQHAGAQDMDPTSQASFDTVMAFMGAMGSGDMDAMADVWAEVHQVACLHPGAAPIFGRDEVLASWQTPKSRRSKTALSIGLSNATRST